MNALQIIQQVTDELGLISPSIAVGSQDPQIRQLLALLNRLGIDICTQFQWQRLNKEHVFSTVAIATTGNTVQGSPVINGIPSTAGLSRLFAISGKGITPLSQIASVDSATQVTMTMPALATGTGTPLGFAQVQYPLPSDWQRQISQTEWDRTGRWPIVGPMSPQEWQSLKSGIALTGPRQQFRIVGNTVTVNPPPPNGLIFAFEYISSAWVQTVGGTTQTRITSDTDSFIYSDSLMITGLKTQWKAAKGLDATYDAGEFRTLLDAAKSQDKSAKKLSLSFSHTSGLLSIANVPESGYGG